LPSIDVADALLDERRELTEQATCQGGRTPSSRRQVLSQDTVAKTEKGLICNGFRGFCPRKASECDYLAVGDCQAAQAVELVRALRDQLHEMTHQLAWLERQDVTGTNGRASAIRCEAAALRRDISRAQFFIDRPQRRYPNSDGHPQPRRPARHQALAEPVVPKVK
jgi:hypothetical protein